MTRRGGGPNGRQARRTRRLIGRALVELMIERRYDRITVQEIIDRADVGRSTFYAHYRDKEDVLTSETERVLALMEQSVAPADEGNGELLPSLALFQHLEQQHPVYQALVRGRGLAVLHETCYDYLTASAEKRLTARARNAPASPVPLPVIAHYVAGTLLNLMRWWLEHERPYPAEQMHEMFQRLVVPAVAEALG